MNIIYKLVITAIIIMAMMLAYQNMNNIAQHANRYGEITK